MDLKSVIKTNTYSRQEKVALRKKIDVVLKSIDAECKKRGISAKSVLGGSAAKGTMIRGDFDCDVFVRFDPSYDSQMISDIIEPVLKIFKGVSRLHGSRDYFQFIKDDIVFEIVPVLKSTPEDALNVTDISPLHVDWVKKKISGTDLSNQIILMKLFCRSQGVYGAESYIKGFSGHVIDILTIHYGGFEKLLKASLRWKEKPVIDTQKHYSNKLEAMMTLNSSKTQSAIIVIDPIQRARNASAVLSLEKLELFKKSAKAYLNSPDKSFFVKKEITVEDIRKKRKRGRLIILEAQPKKGKQDIIGSKLLKSFVYIKDNIIRSGFRLYEADWSWGKEAYFWFMVKDEILSKTRTHKGPPLKMTERVKAFKSKHKSTIERGRCIYAEVKRSFCKIDGLIDSLVKDVYVKEKTKKISRIE